MKKKLTATIMAGLMATSLLGLAACNKEEEGGDQPQATNIVKLNDFETFDRDVQLIRLLNNFGVVNHNADKTYVKSGDRSIQLRPTGFNMSTVPPYIIIPTYSTRFEFGYGDFTKVDYLSMWFYNADDTEIEVGVGVTERAIANGQWYATGYRVPAMYYTLQPGWNRVEYEILPDWLNLSSTFTLDEVHGVYVEFPHSDSPWLEDAPTVYMDDLQIHYQEEAHSSDINLDLKADVENGVWEIADFESCVENVTCFFTRTGSANPRFCVPTGKIVHASKYGVRTTEGENVYEVTLRAGTGEYGWPFLLFSAELLQYAFKQVGQDLIDNPQNYQLSFELYNDQDFKMGLTFYPRSAKDNNLAGVGVQAEPHSWTKYVYNLGKLNDESAKYSENGEKDYITNPGTLAFASGQFNTAEDTSDRHVLLDNLRIEKIA